MFMNNIDQIQSSYNLTIQREIFSEQDKIVEAKQAYFLRCNGIKIDYNEKNRKRTIENY